ncbi:lipopolysaccharide biosynthesis protein [Microbacterium hominis]|uniref:Uncharacterized protein n=1 Tax=Microbacterium hominis TaxID=162426 RepID=A0A0B4CDQ8_9MICO|nr:polysaccharide biosynthesis C-terminal domain-containing protein [Microbacterium hominis]KIC59369.1 hypothetical protein RM52_04000 [Microbacterium hominis]
MSHQTVFFAGSTGIAQLATICIYVLTARLSSVAEYGGVVSSVALAMTIAGFIDFGSNSLWVREISAARKAATEFSGAALTKGIIAAAVAAMWAAVAALAGLSVGAAIAGTIVFAVVVSQSSAVPIRGALETHMLSVGVIVDRIIALVVYFALLASQVAPAVAMVVGLAAGPIAGALTNASITRPLERLRAWSVPANPWHGARYLGLASIAVSAQSMDTPLLTSIAGADASGIYGSVSRWTQPMGLLSSAFATTVGPFIAQAGTVRRAWLALRRAMWLPGLAIAICGLIAALAPVLVPLVLGARYADAVPVLQLVALAALLSVLAQPLFTTLQYLSKERVAARLLGCAVAIQLLLIALLGSSMGALGAALASVSSQLIIVVLSAFAVMKMKVEPDE